eukprot:TRINITY_DN528_c1_g2_i1.p1 TRINITY_DN528_c1_g2~~TRINITY_DN528_c1_g2_i1.p1  ORF type:complete len:619 (+),score=177.47 TRINITY_DN528_c1_g2_i1:173-2029(+)
MDKKKSNLNPTYTFKPSKPTKKHLHHHSNNYNNVQASPQQQGGNGINPQTIIKPEQPVFFRHNNQQQSQQPPLGYGHQQQSHQSPPMNNYGYRQHDLGYIHNQSPQHYPMYSYPIQPQQPYIHHFSQQQYEYNMYMNSIDTQIQAKIYQKEQEDTRRNLSKIYFLHEKNQLVGRVHTGIMKSCNEQGLMLDLVVFDTTSGFNNQYHNYQNGIDSLKIPKEEAEMYNNLITNPKNHPKYILQNIILKWEYLPSTVSNLDPNIRTKSTLQYIPPRTTFRIYCSNIDLSTLQLTIKMSKKPNPVFNLPSNIDICTPTKNLSFFEKFNFLHNYNSNHILESEKSQDEQNKNKNEGDITSNINEESNNNEENTTNGKEEDETQNNNNNLDNSTGDDQEEELTHKIPENEDLQRLKKRPRFLIIIDFEATCDFAPNPIITSLNSEIIEFPWIVLETNTYQIVHEQRFYIKPDEMKGITPYCVGLTGISKEDCENGITLQEAIIKFNEFINTKMLPFGKDSFRIVCDSNWDLAVQFLAETRRKNINIDDDWWFSSYFDLKREFRNFYIWFPFSNRGDPPLFVMLKAFKISFVGRHHSGLDDCFTISQIVKILLQLRKYTYIYFIF